MQLREDARSELEALLAQLSGRVALLLDPALLRVMPHVITTDGLKSLGVDCYVNSEDADIPDASACDTALFLVLPTLASADVLAAMIQRHTGESPDSRQKVRVCFVPRITHEVRAHLQSKEVWGDVAGAGGMDVLEWGLDVLPLDDDLLTLVGQETYYRDAVLWGGDGAPAAACSPGLYYCARALMKLQAMYCQFPHIKAKGRLAKAVLDMLVRLQRENEVIRNRAPAEERGSAASAAAAASSGGASARSEIDMLILLDRGVDLVTPLVMPFTVEAQIKETFRMDLLTTEVDTATFAPQEKVPEGRKPPPPRPKRATVNLNSNDKLYRDIRDAHINAATLHLKEKADELKAFEEGFEKGKQDLKQGMEGIKTTIKKLPKFEEEKRSVAILFEFLTVLHQKINQTAAAEERWSMESDLLAPDTSAKEAHKTAAEACSRDLARGESLAAALRILCLSSVVAGGLPWKQYEAAWKEVVAFYGPPAAFTLLGLERAGLLGFRGGEGGVGSFLTTTGVTNGVWDKVSKALGLMAPPGLDLKALQEDLYYTTNGYAPLSARLCQMAACERGWEAPNVAEALRLLPGPTASVKQGGGEGGARGGGGAARAEREAAGGRRVVLVCFVGGVTHLEVSALRFLSEKCA